MFSTPRGTRDILSDELAVRRRAEGILRETFERYGYREIQTPIFENIELLTAKSGEEILKHLYSFEDKSGRKLALRPELSAPTIRLYVNELRHKSKPRKLYYLENCFRYERPQMGRYREFWQAGVEFIGSTKPEAEAEVIDLAVKCLENLGLSNFSLSIGHLGIIRDILNGYGIEDKMQNHIISLLDKGEVKGIAELPITDSAKEILFQVTEIKGGREKVFKKLGSMLESDSRKALEEFDEILSFMEKFGVKKYKLNLGIARGLDYYTGMVFEIHEKGLGAQNQICGGGSYSLVKLFGGGELPSSGFAFGFDRLMLALAKEKRLPSSDKTPKIFIIPTSKKALQRAIGISKMLREKTSCDLELMGRKLDKSLSYADSEKIPYVVIVKDDSSDDMVILRDMESGDQKTLKIIEVPDAIK